MEFLVRSENRLPADTPAERRAELRAGERARNTEPTGAARGGGRAEPARHSDRRPPKRAPVCFSDHARDTFWS